MAKRKTKRTDFSEAHERLRVLRELVEHGWAELRAKAEAEAEAEGKRLPVEPRKSTG